MAHKGKNMKVETVEIDGNFLLYVKPQFWDEDISDWNDVDATPANLKQLEQYMAVVDSTNQSSNDVLNSMTSAVNNMQSLINNSIKEGG